MERGGVSAYFGANGNGREDGGRDADFVVGEGVEWGDVGGGVVVEVLDPRDNAEGVAMDVLVLRTPDLLTGFVNNCVQMRVSVCNVEARGFGEEVGEEGEVEGGRRLYGGGGDGGRVTERWGWAPNNVFGRRGAGWEDGRDGRQDVLDFFDEREFGDERVKIGSV